MKYFGCILEFTEQRNNALIRAYRKAINECGIINIKQVAEKVVNTPCERFWVSEERAAKVIAAMMNGKPVLAPMRPTKREMFKEIYRRVIELKKKHQKESINELVMRAVNSQAPKFYMQPACAMGIIYKIKNGTYAKK